MKKTKYINLDKSNLINKGSGGIRIDINMPEEKTEQNLIKKMVIPINMPEEKEDGVKANKEKMPIFIEARENKNEKDKPLSFLDNLDKSKQSGQEDNPICQPIGFDHEEDEGIIKEDLRDLVNNSAIEVKNYDKKLIQSNEINREVSILNMERINCNDIAAYILENSKFIFYNNALYHYYKPIYKRLNEHEGKTLVKSILPREIVKKLSDFHLKEILNQIRTTPEIQMDEDEVKVNERHICFKNAVYDIKERKLKKHSHNNYFFSYVNVNYEPDNIEYGKIFEKYLDKCTGGDEDLKELICQVIGYIISNSMHAKKLFILLGVPDSGKSTFGEFIEELLGVDNCCSIDLQDLSKRFQVAELCGKKLCVNMDLPDAPIKDTGVIKQLTGNDSVPAERKYEAPFRFKNEAKLLYGANNLPCIENGQNSRAFFNRLVIIPFNYSIPKNEQDKKLKAKLIKERNYITHKCIQSLERLKANNYEFVTSSKSEFIKRNYIISNNSVFEFISEKCFIGKGIKIYKSYLYEHYLNFCKENGYKEKETFSSRKFSTIIAHNFNVIESRWREGNLNQYGFEGISIKE